MGADLTNQTVNIWSFEHNGWWAPNEMGYVPDRSRAGVYTMQRAVDICSGANVGEINEAIVPLTADLGDRINGAFLTRS